MGISASAGTVVSRPRLYQTVPVSTVSQAEQQDRYMSASELDRLSDFFRSGAKRLQVVSVLSANYEVIVSRAASRIFTGGAAMSFLERPPVAGEKVMSTKEGFKLGTEFYVEAGSGFGEALRNLFVSQTGVPVPPGFRTIDVGRYGPDNMRKSMRDLAWFLRYITYAIACGDPSIVAINTRSLREFIEEACSADALLVALGAMKQTSTGFFRDDAESAEIVSQYFDAAISEFAAPTPSAKLRPRKTSTGVSLQGLQLPQIYNAAAEQVPVFSMKPGLSGTEKLAVVKAAYRQIFERDIQRAYGQGISDLESKVKNGEISMKEFVRRLGKSPLYQKEFYQPFVNSRVVELAFRHFLGRAPETTEEFSAYFDIVTKKGLGPLVDALVDSQEYGDYYGEEIVPYIRKLGVEAQTSANWGAKFDLYNYAAPRRKVPQFITLFAASTAPLPNQHAYGKGNDGLEIQFGAIFPKDTVSPSASPAFFNKDVKRILIPSGLTLSDRRGAAEKTFRNSGMAPTVVRLTQSTSNRSKSIGKQAGITGTEGAAQSAIRACYQRVYGYEPYSGQRLTSWEIKLENGDITVREFVRQLAKSDLVRNKYWSRLYIVKAIEYLHRHLLGRPTYGRQEINPLFDIASKVGYYAVIDAMIDSKEYETAFGEDTVPYERYVTPGGLAMRNFRKGSSYLSSNTSAPKGSPVTAAVPDPVKRFRR
jgi:phycobilisome core-membrane linker protein